MSKFIPPYNTKFQKENKEKTSYWVTDCTYDIELKYSYEEKTKIRQTQSC